MSEKLSQSKKSQWGTKRWEMTEKLSRSRINLRSCPRTSKFLPSRMSEEEPEELKVEARLRK
jgi:hypothetical protein